MKIHITILLPVHLDLLPVGIKEMKRMLIDIFLEVNVAISRKSHEALNL